MNKDSYQKVLIFSLAGIGDSILFSPALKLFHENFPQTEIHVLVMFKGVIDYFKRFPEVQVVHYWDFFSQSKLKSIQYLLRLRKQQYDLVINAYPSNRAEYNMVAKILGKRQAGHRYQHYNWGNFYFLNQTLVQEDLHRHPADENIELVKALGAQGEPTRRLSFPLIAEERQMAQTWIRDKKLNQLCMVGFHAGSSTTKNHINKRWAPEMFAELGRMLHKQHSASLLIFGGPEEKDLMDQLQRTIGPAAVSVLGTKLGESAALIEQCHLFVSNDTSLMHISAAFQVPCVVIFGPTDVRKGRPYHSPHIIASKFLSCSPCFHYSPTPISCKWGTFECVKDLTVSEVARCCEEFLEKISEK